MAKPDSPILVNGRKPNSPTSEPEPEPNYPSDNIQIPESVSQLETLATEILKFKSLYDDLTNHLNYIEKCIDARTETQSEVDLFTLCKNMQGKSLRRYIIERLNHLSKLREELPRAIRSAQNPAQLVLDCVGRFYVQGKKAFEKEAQLGAHRRACVLALDALLKGYEEEEEGVVLVGQDVRSEGLKGARDWMGRVRVEGGVAAAHEMDARGLLLFVACFGVPEGFSDDEVWDLVVAGDFKRVALRKSRDLVARIAVIVEKMMKNGMKIEAIDVVLAFGLEDKFPLEKILVLYLKGCDEAFKRKKQEAKDNLNLLKETIEKHLTTLKSAMKLIEDHKQEGLQHPPGWDLNEMISKVQKEHNDVGRKLNGQHAKRKAEQDRVELIEDIKRSRFVSAVSIQNSGRNECATVRHVDGNIPFYSSMGTEMFEDGLSHHDDVYAACEPRMYGSHMGSFPETVLHEQRATDHWNLETSYDRQLYSRSTLDTTFQGAGIGYFPETIPVRMARAGSHVQSGGVGPMTIYNDPPTSFVNEVHRGTEVDRIRHIMGQPSGSCGIRDTAHNDRPVGRGAVGEPASGFFVRSLSIERFVGFPISPPSGSAAWSSADLYKFVDAVVEMEYGRSSTSYYRQR